jgi:hypothetical protein
MQHPHVFEPELHPRGDDLLFGVGNQLSLRVAVPTGGRDDDEVLLRPAGELDELLVDPRAIQVPATDDDQCAFGRTVLRRFLRRLLGDRPCRCQLKGKRY